MTTTHTPPRAASPTWRPPARWQIVLAVGAVLSTLPYGALKLMWLGGSDIGLKDARLSTSTVMEVANSITLAMSLTGAVLAVVLLRPVGLRLPGWSVMTPLFVGTGLLGGILVLLPIQFLLGARGSQPASDPDDPIEAWVYPVVYGGFALMGVCLLGLFAAYAWRRWLVPGGWTAAYAAWRPVPRRARRVAVAHGIFMVAIAVVEGVVVAEAGGFGGHQVVAVLMALLCLGGLTSLARRRPAHRRGTVAVVATFVGTAVAASWALFFFVLLLTPNPLVGDAEIPAALAVITGVRALNAALTLLCLHRLRPRAAVTQCYVRSRGAVTSHSTPEADLPRR